MGVDLACTKSYGGPERNQTIHTRKILVHVQRVHISWAVWWLSGWTQV